MKTNPDIDIRKVFRSSTVRNALKNYDLEYIRSPLYGDQKEDLFLKDYLNEKGFGGLPEVLTKDELDEYIHSGEIELFRGINGYPIYCDYFREGPLFVGCGFTGNGIYAAYGVDVYGETALQRASNYGPYILRMSLKTGARVISFDDIAQLFNKIGARIDAEIDNLEQLKGSSRMIQTALKNRKNYKLMILSDYGRFAATLDCDAIDIKANHEMLILNRTMLRVQDKNVDYEA